jgi:hypothetical protein
MRTKPKHSQQNNGSNSTEGPIAIQEPQTHCTTRRDE